MRLTRAVYTAALCGALASVGTYGCARGLSGTEDAARDEGDAPDAPDAPDASDAPDEGDAGPRDGGDPSSTSPPGAFQSAGGGTATSPSYRLNVSIGAPQPMGRSSSARHRVTIGPARRLAGADE